jgi:hypothetical protein
MRTHLSLLLLSTACLGLAGLKAQNWVNGGNTLAANGTLGTNSNYSLIFETNATERGRITNGGNWGIGTASPLSKLAVNSAASASPLRASIAGVHKFIVNGNGGVSIGSSTAGPANGLYVAGNVGIGTATPSYKLHVVGKGSITDSLIVKSLTAGSPNVSVGIKGTGSNYGVFGSSTYLGVYGNSSYTGVYGEGGSYGVYGYSSGNNGVGGFSSTGKGVYGSGNWGVYGSSSNYGVYGNSSYVGVYGNGTSYGVSGAGRYGLSGTGSYIGVFGTSTDGTAVVGNCTNGTGGNFFSNNGYGLVAGTGRSDKNWAGVFNGNTYAYGAYQTSDRNLKKDIQDIGEGMKIITQLKPRIYEFKKDEKIEQMHLPSGKHYGLIAQELEEVLPSLVKEVDFQQSALDAMPADSAASNVKHATITHVKEKITSKAINYVELIPIIIKGMQEQQQMIEQLKQHNYEQQQQIENLKTMVSKLSIGQGFNTFLSRAELGEVTPNPVKSNAIIQYAIPEGSTRAQLLITDALGRSIRQITLSTSGVINLDVYALASGVYNYSLIVDNKTVATKKMTVIK